MPVFTHCCKSGLNMPLCEFPFTLVAAKEPSGQLITEYVGRLDEQVKVLAKFAKKPIREYDIEQDSVTSPSEECEISYHV